MNRRRQAGGAMPSKKMPGRSYPKGLKPAPAGRKKPAPISPGGSKKKRPMPPKGYQKGGAKDLKNIGIEESKEVKFGGPSRKRAQEGLKGFTQPIKPKKSEPVKDDKLSAQLAAESAKVAITPSGPKKVEQKKSSGGGSYAQAKKNNPNLDKLISQRKGLKKGTPEYNAVQNKINKAYGKGPTNRPTAKPAEKPKAAPAPMKTAVKPVERGIKFGESRVAVKPENLSKAMAEQGLKQAGERLQKSKTSQASPTTKKESRIMSRADKKVGKIQDRRAKAAGRREERQDRKEGRMNKRSAVKEARGTKRAAIRKARGKGVDMKEALKGASPGWPSDKNQPRKKAFLGVAKQVANVVGQIAPEGSKIGNLAKTAGQVMDNPLQAAGNLIKGQPIAGGGQQQQPAAPPAAPPSAAPPPAATGQPDQQQTMKKGGKKRKKYQEGGGKMQKMKKKDAPQLAMSRDTRDWTEKQLGVKNPSRAITKKEKDRRDSFRRPRHIKKPLSVMQKGGAKPDYLDMDKDGNKTESMKSALKDRRSKARYGKKK